MRKNAFVLKVIIGSFIFIFGAGFILTPSAFALNREDLIKKAYQEMLDRDPSPEELAQYVDSFPGYDNLRSYLNSIEERNLAITLIYNRALKRAPQNYELEFHIRTANPSNNIRKQLLESGERELAIDDVYRNILNRLPREDEKDFLNLTRTSLETQQYHLLWTEERNLMVDTAANHYLGRDAFIYEKELFNYEKPLRDSAYDFYYGHDIDIYYTHEKTKQENIYYVDDDNWGILQDGTESNPYHSIQAAVESVPEWSTIFVREGKYYNRVETVVNVDLVGERADKVSLYGDVVVSDNSKVTGFHIKPEDTGILVYGRNIIIRNNIISFAENGGGIYIYANDNPVIENNTIVGCRGIAIGAGSNNSTPSLRNNIIVVNGEDIPFYSKNELRFIGYNLIWGNKEQNYDLDPNNTVYEDPMFVDNTNFYLKQGSPAIDAGDPRYDYSNEPEPNGRRIDIGAYGNTSEAGGH